MMGESQNAHSQAIMSNAGSEGVIKIRLDTSKIMQDMELFLKGITIVHEIDPESNMPVAKVVVTGKSIANDRGVQAILMTLSQTVNSHGVQGNWSNDYFKGFVCEVDKNFSKAVSVNLQNWEIAIENYNVVCDAFMNLIQQFASRIIENKERESYGLSMKTTESSTLNQGRQGIFGGR